MSATLSSRLLALLFAVSAVNPVFSQEEESTDETAVEAEAQEDAAATVKKDKKRVGRPEIDLGKPTLPVDWADEFDWRSIGPANMGGRITDVAVHPTDPCEFWIAAAGGGLLHTTNNGVSYEYQFDSERTNSLGAVAVAPSDPTIVWVGTGEANPRNSVSWGDGVYKSTDSGKTWTHMGLAEGFQTGGIAIHPTDPNIVYVGMLGRLWGPNEERGLYKTTDGGVTWNKVLYIDEDTGVVELKMDPSNPEHLLVGTYDRRRDEFCTNDPASKWGEGSGIYRTTDGGASFNEVTEGLPKCKLGRIGIDFYGADPKVVYAIVETERITQEPENAAYMGVTAENAEVGARITEVTEKSPAAEAGLSKDDLILRINDNTVLDWNAVQKKIRTSLAGDTIGLEIVRDGEVLTIECTFTTRPEEEEDGETTDSLGYPRAGRHSIGLGGQRANIQDEQGPEGSEYGGVYRSSDGGVTWERINSLNPRPMYYSEIRIDPSNADHVYVLGTQLWRSSDGGVTFTSDGGRGIHVDHHALWIDPADGRHMILGNDGGIHVTWDRMDSWDHHNHVAIGQFYNVTVDTQTDYKVYGGLQDNGSWGGPSRLSGGTINSDWIRVGGGDGFVCRVDANDPDLVYYESQNGGMGYSNLRTGEGGSLRPRGPRGTRFRFNWNTPFLLSHHNSLIHYSAGNHVFRSLGRGNAQRKISPDITATERGSATALGESPLDSDILYVGTDDGALWTTRDGGNEWIDLWALNAKIEKPEPEKADIAVAAEEAASEPVHGPNAENVTLVHAAVTDGPINGTWLAKAAGEGIESDDQGRFSLDLKLGEDGKVTGTIDAEIGAGPIRSGKWNKDEKKLSFVFETDSLRLDFGATIEDGAMAGTISGAGGAFSFDFTASRETVAEAAAEAVADAEVAAVTEDPAQDPAQPAEGDDPGEDEPKKAKKRKHIEDTIDQLMPGRRYVSNVVPSKYKASRVYLTLDGHRSDDLVPYVFTSEDGGESWKSLRGNLPDAAGSVRAFSEDIENGDVLYLGTEFGAWVSIDAGESWAPLGADLPTVAVHDLVQHPTSGELIAGTHGRSVWITDVTALRQMSEKTVDADAHLYEPGTVIRWRRGQSRGSNGTRAFVGENPATGAQIWYSLGKNARSVALSISDASGETLYAFTDLPLTKGLHGQNWGLRVQRTADSDDSAQRGRFRRSRFRLVEPGKYIAVLVVDGTRQTQEFEVLADPTQRDSRWIAFEEWNETRFDVEEEEDGQDGGDGDDL